MNQILKNILLRRIQRKQLPYGMAMPSFINEFRENISTIKEEWDLYIKRFNYGSQFDEISKEQVGLNDDKKWNVLPIYGYFYFNLNVKKDFPTLFELIERNKSEINLVLFSTTLAKKTIPTHTGNNPSVNRIQIGIDIKESEKCYLRVVDKKIYLKEKEFFIFDDTYEHELVNDGNAVRTVLLIDTYKKLPWFYKRLIKKYNEELSKSEYVQSVLASLKIN